MLVLWTCHLRLREEAHGRIRRAMQAWCPRPAPAKAGACAGPSAECLVARPDDNLLCSVCLSLFDTPLRTACGHVFCEGCIRPWLKEQPACPTCRAPVVEEELAPDRLAGALVDNLPSRCQLHASGCTWIGRHGEVRSHLASSCPCVRLSCPGCDEEMPRSAMAEHALTCVGGAPRECPFGCGERILGAEAMAEHKAACLMEPRKLLAALGHLQRENETLARENLEMRARAQGDPMTGPGKKRRARGPGMHVE